MRSPDPLDFPLVFTLDLILNLISFQGIYTVNRNLQNTCLCVSDQSGWLEQNESV